MFNILSHIFNISLYVMENHGISCNVSATYPPIPTFSSGQRRPFTEAPSSACNAVPRGAPTRPRAEVWGREAGTPQG